MKEVTRVSLAALPYNIEVDAKKELERYLHAIEAALDADADAMKEIEARIVELLDARSVSGEKVISLDDVRDVRRQLGEPRAFVDDDVAHELDDGTNIGTTDRRLMRDASDQVLGGVCSGIAAYFHVDPAWVRLAFVVLGFVTVGAMILFYPILWIIMPVARTAAERLQMKGADVTPSAIQKESAIITQSDQREHTVRVALRIMAGIGSLIVGLSALICMVVTVYHLTHDQYARLTTSAEWFWIAWALLAGLLFVVFCVVIARALFTARFTKRFWISLGILTLAGIASFAVGVLGYGSTQWQREEMIRKAFVEKPMSGVDWSKVKRLKVDSRLPITINYNPVTSTNYSTTLWYNTITSSKQPNVNLSVLEDGTLLAAVDEKDTSCLPDMMRCQSAYTLTMVGPELESVEAGAWASVHYNAGTQAQLGLNAHESGDITLQSTGTIGEVDAQTANDGTITLTDASVTTVKGTINSTGSLSGATVQHLALTVPTACTANGQAYVHFVHATTMTVNGSAFDSTRTYDCSHITIEQ